MPATQQQPSKTPVPPNVSTALKDTSLEKLKKAFDPQQMVELISATMHGRYDRTDTYIDVLTELFYKGVPKDTRTHRSRLSEQDRERCVIALLAARGAFKDLAIHVYCALMLDVTPEEIADIIFLAGVYSGVPAVADGLEILIKTLSVLEETANPPTPKGSQPPPKPDVRKVFVALSGATQL